MIIVVMAMVVMVMIEMRMMEIRKKVTCAIDQWLSGEPNKSLCNCWKNLKLRMLD